MEKCDCEWNDFVKKQYEEEKEPLSSDPMLGDLTPLKDFLMACRFAENEKIREESESLLRRYFA